MTTYYSPEYYCTNGTYTGHTPPADVIISNIQFNFKGVNNVVINYGNKTGNVQSHDFHTGGVCCTGITIPSVSGAEIFDSMNLYATVHPNGHLDAITLWHVDTGADCSGTVIDWTLTPELDWEETYNWITPIPSSHQGHTHSMAAACLTPYVCEPYGNNIYAKLFYHTETTTKTTNPYSTCHGYNCGYTGVLNEGYWSGWQNANSNMLWDGVLNAIYTYVSGSGKCYMKFKYDYVSAITEYTKTKTLQYVVELPPPPTPTALGYLKVRTATGTQTIRICSPSDPYLDYDCVRICDDNNIRCLDVVATNHPDASPLRIRTSNGTLAFRKVV